MSRHFPSRVLFLLTLFFLSTLSLVWGGEKSVVVLRIESPSFSPDGNGIQDYVYFSPVFKKNRQITHWQLKIKKGFRTVTTLRGLDLPALIRWDGVDRKNHLALPGLYKAVLSISGRDFDAQSLPVIFQIDTSPPHVELSVSTAEWEVTASSRPLIFSPLVWDESPLDRWQLQILSPVGQTVFLSWSTGTVRNVEWDGLNQATGFLAPPGLYRAVYDAWDSAGNESSSVYVDVVLKGTQKDILMKSIKTITVFQQEKNLVLSLKEDQVFGLVQSQWVLKKEALLMLKEVGLLINAYPDADIVIEGMASSSSETAQQWAWLVYNNLVKVQYVVASRLRVQHRAASPLDPGVRIVIQNGAE